MKKIIHIITGLNNGGAENMLFKILKYSNKKEYYQEVISLKDEGVYGEKIKNIGINVHCLKINKKNIISSVIKTRNIIKHFDIIVTWLYHADLFGFFVGKILLRKKLIWNIRHSNLDKETNKANTLKLIKINSFLSRWVDIIIYNSHKALETHKKNGYKNNNAIVLPNGFELDKFKFNIEDRKKIRKDLKLTSKDKVIITVGRWNIQKDYYTLLKALNELKKKNFKFKMIMVGNNLDYKNKELLSLINEYNLENNVILLGIRSDIPALLSAADIYVSSSLGESFSNAIGEAMACELPCVVTDVGDSKQIVGDTGICVPPRDSVLLAQALENYLNAGNLRNFGKKARQKIMQNYNINEIVKEYEKIYSKYLS